MISKYTAIIIVLLILIIHLNTHVMVKNSYNGKAYSVMNFSDKQEASDLLYEVNHRLVILFKYVKYKYGDSYEPINKMLGYFDPDIIAEMIPNKISPSVAYVIDKGDVLNLCLRKTFSDYSLHDINIIMFVVLHEVSHLTTEDIEHTQQFWENFHMILKNAVECGIYEPTDYSKHNIKFCRSEMNITYNPLYDHSLFTD